MAKRVSHSLLDPFLTAPIKKVYPAIKIPGRFPPEGIVVLGHLLAIVGACGFYLVPYLSWAGALIILGVAGNHFMDCIDGTHARATDQCRNGGELLDHFTDPLSFSYWVAAWGSATGHLELSIIGVLIIYATAVLTSIVAKLTGTFELARFGPTEFKTLLVVFGIAVLFVPGGDREAFALWTLLPLLGIGLVQLLVNLWLGIRTVNRTGTEPDTSDWDLTANK